MTYNDIWKNTGFMMVTSEINFHHEYLDDIIKKEETHAIYSKMCIKNNSFYAVTKVREMVPKIRIHKHKNQQQNIKYKVGVIDYHRHFQQPFNNIVTIIAIWQEIPDVATKLPVLGKCVCKNHNQDRDHNTSKNIIRLCSTPLILVRLLVIGLVV